MAFDTSLTGTTSSSVSTSTPGASMGSTGFLSNPRVRQRIDALNQFKERSLATSRGYVRDHPMRSTMMAMAAGALLQRVIGGRRSRHY